MMRRDESIFVLWHTSVLGLVAVAVQMGWAAPLLGSGRELVAAIIGGLYALGVILSGALLWRLAHGDVPFVMRRLRGIDQVTWTVVMIGLAGTFYGVVVGTSNMGAAADGADAAVRVVGTMGQALGLGFTATLFSIVATIALRIGRHFVGNVVAYQGVDHG